jgi:hypothetical protein
LPILSKFLDTTMYRGNPPCWTAPTMSPGLR